VALMICIRELRQALGDDPRAPRFIETLHRRGYRLVGDLPLITHPSGSLRSQVRSAVLPVGREAELTRTPGLSRRSAVSARWASSRARRDWARPHW
jgi:DNA-binding winged helix-turn-helix (wHTH) protein